MNKITFSLLVTLVSASTFSQVAPKPGTDVTAPLHALQSDYPVPYNGMSEADIKKVLDKVYNYLDAVTLAQMINRQTGQEVTDASQFDTAYGIKPGDFRLTAYEWGVTYSGMLLAAETSGDTRYNDYVKQRLAFIAKWIPAVKKKVAEGSLKGDYIFRQPIAPHALDDAGSMCAAMIKVTRSGLNTELRPIIDNYINYISTKEFRLPDGTLARNRPQKNTIWLDDLYMSVPALVQMGKLTGKTAYYDDAVKQIRQFTQRMFDKEKGVYLHGWVQDMNPHPAFYWGCANGWAIMAMVELLDVLPDNHAGRPFVLQQLQAHARGLAAYQSGLGFWYQLLNRTDSYLETSATAIYAYCIAHACNKGWLDAKAYAPMAMLAWNAVTTKVNTGGQVEGVCVGTGMAFDPVFYYYRSVNVYAAHGYGPVLLAGAEMIRLVKKDPFKINDRALQYYE